MVTTITMQAATSCAIIRGYDRTIHVYVALAAEAPMMMRNGMKADGPKLYQQGFEFSSRSDNILEVESNNMVN